MNTRLALACAAPLFCLLAVCGRGGSSGLLVGTIYTGDTGNDRVAGWDMASTVDGNVAPDRIISGATSGIDDPFDVSYDSRSDTLFVGSQGTSSIKIYDDVATKTGDVAPDRELAGAMTLLDGMAGYVSVVDETRDILYVAYVDGVLAFASASTLDGDVAPSRNITGGATVVDNDDPHKRMFIDETNDRLYVTATDTVAVFDTASTKTGNVAPDRVIAGAMTGFGDLWGIAVDVGGDVLYVSDETADSIFVFDTASTLMGDVPPDRTITGPATLLDSPAAIFLDEAADRLYSTTEGASLGILVWDDASTVTGDMPPDRAVTGGATGVANVDGLVGAM